MIRSFLTVSTGTLASRLLGFARDAMVAALLGAGPIADAFLVAFQLTNVARRLLTEGALNTALVPAWLRVNDTKGPAAAAAFAGRVLGTVSVLVIAIAAVAGLLMPVIMIALAPGFSGEETLHLAVNDARLMLPYLAFAGPAAVTMALLNAHGRFALTAFAPLLFNIALLVVMTALVFMHRDAADAALAIAATVGLAGLLQLLILISRGSGLAKPLRVVFDSEMRGFFAKAIPGMVSGAGPQILLVAGAIVASASPSAVSWLYFANRLIELPLGIVGVTVGAVLIGELTRAVRADDGAAIAHAQSRSLELAMALALPAMIGLMVLSGPLVRLLFEHGAFGASDTDGTARALRWLALGLPPQVLIKTLAPAFFARSDTTTPLWATLKGFGVTIALAFVSGWLFGVEGIAAGVAIGAWSSALVLIRHGITTFGFAIDAGARRRLPRIAAATGAMGALLWLLAPFLPAASGNHYGLAYPILVVTMTMAGIAIYGLFLVLLGVTSWGATINAFREIASPRLRD